MLTRLNTVLLHLRSVQWAAFFARFGIVLILVFAFAIRVYGLGNIHYGIIGELYRDLNVELDFFVNHSWPLLGPSSSLGGLHFGPAYYYLLAPFFYLFHYRPEGAVFAGVFFSVLSVYILYRLLDLWFGNRAVSLCGALLLAVSVVDIQNSWYAANPNFLPAFVLGSLFFLTKQIQGRARWWEACCLGFCLGVAGQLHTTALVILSLTVAGVFVMYRKRLKYSSLAAVLVGAAVAYIPYGYYELTHNFENLRRLLFLGGGGFGLVPHADNIVMVASFWQNTLVLNNTLADWYVEHKVLTIGLLAGYAMVAAAAYLRYRKYNHEQTHAMPPFPRSVIIFWAAIGTAVLIFSAVKLQLFYVWVMWPLPIILFSWIAGKFFIMSKRWGAVLICAYVLGQLFQLPFLYSSAHLPSYNFANLQGIFNQVKIDASGKSYSVINNFADVNEAIYYKRVFNLPSEQSVSLASTLYIIESSQAKPDAVLSNYKLNKSFIYNGFFIKKYDWAGQ